jgi:3,4-dihydroxy 2-butanone 4-phosphate synthase/GTP cyclohydrolase II
MGAPAGPWPRTGDDSRGAAADRRVEISLSELAAGRPVLVLRREGASGVSGALVLAATSATPELVAFVVRHSSGFLCVAIGPEVAARLDLPPMAPDGQREDGLRYAVTVDASEGISTGISAADRARTIRLLGDPRTAPAQLSRPGHVVPVIPAADGVLGRQGFAEAAWDLVAHAGVDPAALVAHLVTDDGSPADAHELRGFADQHGLACLDLEDLVSFRVRRDCCVERLAVRHLPAPHEGVRVVEYRQRRTSALHLAFARGSLRARDDVPLYVHPACPDGDLFAGTACGCRSRLERALDEIQERGAGVLLYLRPEDGTPGGGHCLIEPAQLAAVASMLRDLGPRSLLVAPWQSEDVLRLREHGLVLRRPAGARPDPATPLPEAVA